MILILCLLGAAYLMQVFVVLMRLYYSDYFSRREFYTALIPFRYLYVGVKGFFDTLTEEFNDLDKE